MTQPYPSYKDSGHEELPSLPAHWTFEPLKRLCTVFPSNVDKHSVEGETPVRLCNYTDVYYRDEITSSIDFMMATATEQEIKKFSLRIGDTIFTKDSETADDIAIAALVVEELPRVVCGYHLSVARPTDRVKGSFIKRFFDSLFAKAMFEVRANGLTRVGLGQRAVENVPVPLPPLDEQRAIAAFLDRETGKIDALVEEQRRLIALLKEKRQAVISHAVTKGLDPDAPMKPSGIEWLGEVPCHWVPTPLRYVAKFINGAAFKPVDWSDQGTPIIRIENLNGGEDFNYYEGEVGPQYIVKEGDILFGWSGNRGASFGPFIWKRPGRYFLNQHIFNVQGYSCDRAWFYWCLRAVTEHVEEQSHGIIGMVHITKGNLAAIRVPIPPLEEQRTIAEFLNRETGKIDALISEAETAIYLLQERRSALISAAVTGKIDVRDAAPDDTEAA